MSRIFYIMAALALPAGAQTLVNAPTSGAQVNLTIAQEAKGANTLVSDRRAVTLPAGRALVRFGNVSGDIASVSGVTQPSFSGAAPVELLEQRFRFDTGRPGAAIERFEGKTISIVRADGKQFSGTLMRSNEDWILENADGYVVNATGTFLLPKAPEGLVTAPTLEWDVNTRAAGAYQVDVRYPTGGLSWSPLYRATLSPGGDRLALNVWLNVANTTGADFRDAQLTLQTGTLSGKGVALPYPRPVTLLRGERRQLNYLAGEMAIQTELTADFSGGSFGDTRALVPTLSVRLKNDETTGLGQPLPAGDLVVLRQGANGALRLLGERKLAFLPVGEELFLPLEEIPEITVSRGIVSRKLNPKVTQHVVTFSIENGRKQAAILIVRDTLPAGAKITETSADPDAQGANTIRFRVEVPANAKADLSYTVQTGG
jgi:hypothetical protein